MKITFAIMVGEVVLTGEHRKFSSARKRRDRINRVIGQRLADVTQRTGTGWEVVLSVADIKNGERPRWSAAQNLFVSETAMGRGERGNPTEVLTVRKCDDCDKPAKRLYWQRGLPAGVSARVCAECHDTSLDNSIAQSCRNYNRAAGCEAVDCPAGAYCKHQEAC